MLAGVSRPTEGLITQRPRQVGYVPERLPARLQMTGREYLAHMGRLRSLDISYAARRSEDLAARLSLNPSLDVRVRSLSKGNSQKVALAQAFLAPVGLLLLDEPWSGLDPSASEGLREEMSSARNEGTAVVATSHRARRYPRLGPLPAALRWAPRGTRSSRRPWDEGPGRGRAGRASPLFPRGWSALLGAARRGGASGRGMACLGARRPHR